jgi:hypothetical protein
MRGYTLLRNVASGTGEMAIYRFEAKVISRGSGRSTVSSASYRSGRFANCGKSTVSAAAYRAGALMVDARTGTRVDYTKKQGVLGAEVMVPDGALPWMRDRQQLWNAIEAIERRCDAQLARDFILTLPHELTHEQRVALTREFVREQFCAKGLVADIAWHAPGKHGDDRNYHAHVMIPMRRCDESGFARLKDRPGGAVHPAKAWKEELARLRIAWADTANKHLEAAGLDIRIDHRSLSERGEDREPEPKIGPVAQKMEREGKESLAGNDNRDVRARNAERAALKVELAHAAAEEAQILDLVAHRLRSGEMKPELTADEVLRQHERELERLQELKQQEARATFKRRATEEAEEAKRKQAETVRDEARRQSEGEVANASARYSIALADNYDIRDPYGSLACAAMKEYGSFIREQEVLRRQMMQESDPVKRRGIDLRKQIEAHDYMAITSQRLAGISATISGREDAPQARLDRARAAAYGERSAELRKERSELIARTKEKNDGTTPARANSGFASSRPDSTKRDEERQEDSLRSNVTGRREGDAELSDAKREKLDRLSATRATYAQNNAQRRDNGRGGGRGR